MQNMLFVSHAIELHKSVAVYWPRVVKRDC